MVFLAAGLIVIDSVGAAYVLGGWLGVGILWVAAVAWLAWEAARAPEL